MKTLPKLPLSIQKLTFIHGFFNHCTRILNQEKELEIINQDRFLCGYILRKNNPKNLKHFLNKQK